MQKNKNNFKKKVYNQIRTIAALNKAKKEYNQTKLIDAL